MCPTRKGAQFTVHARATPVRWAVAIEVHEVGAHARRPQQRKHDKNHCCNNRLERQHMPLRLHDRTVIVRLSLLRHTEHMPSGHVFQVNLLSPQQVEE